MAENWQLASEHALDALDLRIAAALQLCPRASWRRLSEMVGSTEFTVSRRAERLLQTGVVRTTVIADSATPGFRVLIQIVADVAHVAGVGHALALRSDTRFVALITGAFDVVAEVIVPSYRHLASVILEELPAIPGITHTTTETVVRNFKTAYDWSAALLDPGVDVPVQAGMDAFSMSSPRIDDVDRGLIQELQRDARVSYVELASRCHVTESMARRRVEHLISRGAIRPIALVDPAILGFGVELLVLLKIDLSRLEEVATALSTRREVRYVSATSGFSDLACEVITRSPDASYEFITSVLGALPGIREINTATELVTLKRAHVIFP